jgi:hypothetical protein
MRTLSGIARRLAYARCVSTTEQYAIFGGRDREKEDSTVANWTYVTDGNGEQMPMITPYQERDVRPSLLLCAATFGSRKTDVFGDRTLGRLIRQIRAGS